MCLTTFNYCIKDPLRSPSMATASVEGACVLIDESIRCIKGLMQSLVSVSTESPFAIPVHVAAPSLLISVIACDHSSVVRSLLHNAELNLESLEGLIQLVEARF